MTAPAGVETRLCQRVDERQLLAFAAAVHDTSPALFDLDRPGGVVAHPVFPVAFEWPLVEHGPPGMAMTDDEAHGGIHVGHEITWHRPLRAGESLVTCAQVETVDRRSIGAYVVSGFQTTTTAGDPIVSTRQAVIYLGLDLPTTAGRRDPGDLSSVARHGSTADLGEAGRFDVRPEDPVIYTECTGIWNPIHTDPRAARSKGLAAPILHGTATLARTVSIVLGHHGIQAGQEILRLGCRFTTGVPIGETVAVLSSLDEQRRQLRFEARLASGQAALSDGYITLRATAGLDGLVDGADSP